TALIMPRTGPRVTSTMAAPRPARRRGVPRPRERTSGPRQGPAHGKCRPVSYPLLPYHARQGADGTAQGADAGHQQGRCLAGGESTLAHGKWGICHAGAMAWTPTLRGKCAAGEVLRPPPPQTALACTA